MREGAKRNVKGKRQGEKMSQKSEFHNLDNPHDGLLRELASGVSTRIFSGEHAMLSVVTIAPNAQGTLHHHPEEQWGVLLEGSAIRVQGGEEIPVKKGDFWRTPGNVPHTMRAGPEGARVLDAFRALHELSTGRRARALPARSLTRFRASLCGRLRSNALGAIPVRLGLRHP